jgi:putative FmdB family regulatory protein
MPRYEYRCADCGKVFEAILTLREHEEGKVACPGCQSSKVEQRPAGFYAVTSKKS